MATPVLNYISEQDYLKAERKAFEKHEYYKGEIYARTPSSFAHNRIFTNLFGEIGVKVKGKHCKLFGSDFRVHVPLNSLYAYPDLSVFCGKVDLTDEEQDTTTNPSVLIEILSHATRDYDKGSKFTLYRDIESLKEYILVDSTEVSVEKFIRHPDNSWQLTVYKSLTDVFPISTVKIGITLTDIYEGVNFT